MMEWLGRWLTGVTAAAILCALADRLMPEGAVRRVGKLALGLVMLFAMVRPLVQIPVESPAELFSDYQAQTAAQAQELEQGRNEAMKAIIEQEFAAYIVDKADQMGVACTAQVTCQAGEDGVFLPQSAQVVGNFSPQQQEALAQILEEELGLPRDRQTISNKGGVTVKLSWPKGLLPGAKKLLSRYQSVLLVIAAGVLLLLLPLGGGSEEASAPASGEGSESFSLEEFEEKLEQTLSQIKGAGEAKVVLSLKSGSRQVLAQDTQRGADGDTSSSTVTLGRGSGSQEVVPLQTIAPQFQGALVVCPGGDDPEVCLQIIQAVSALTGLGSDRISVCPSQN